MRKIVKAIRRFLGGLGLLYCPKCGSKLVFSHRHGFFNDEVYRCPNKCQFIEERIDL